MKYLGLKDVGENEEDNMGGMKLFMSFPPCVISSLTLLQMTFCPFVQLEIEQYRSRDVTSSSGNTRNTLLHNGVDLCRSETALL